MDFESPHVEKEFPGLYASESSRRSNSDYGDSGHERGGKKELLRSKKKERNDKKKDKGYTALGEDSSPDDMEGQDTRNPLKPKKQKSFKFLHKREKEEKEDRKEEKRKEKVERKIDKRKEKVERRKEEGGEKMFKKDKKKKEEQEEEEVPVFGVPLCLAVQRCPAHDGIQLPAIVRECIDQIEEWGLHCEGIYRLSGVKSKAHQLRRLYNTGEAVRLCDQEPHVIASFIKQYLRELPEPVLTSDMMPHFEDVAMIPNPRERAEAMRQLINRLPTACCSNTCSSIWDTSLQGELPEPVMPSDMMPHFEDVAIIPNPGERAEAMRQLINRLPTANRLLLQYMFKHMGHIIARVPEDAFPWTAAGDILLRGCCVASILLCIKTNTLTSTQQLFLYSYVFWEGEGGERQDGVCL
ncbi:ralA-binding protein 1-like isoform X4 [Eriocheir sinensis]|uniref:ralA-binding protein 1-like isoform X4 n=1 Tax=Eriocheir sinensis TaxID=95602 RepID=UPI0021C775D2|nr:ralA-binding protein 1-like isoform X4 [Eriocheir sinensis]